MLATPSYLRGWSDGFNRVGRMVTKGHVFGLVTAEYLAGYADGAQADHEACKVTIGDEDGWRSA
jgi:hypothetical protein